jgi:hypothetical protein
MKKFINEAKRFQELAGIITENEEELSQFPGGKEYPSFANPLEGFPTEYKELLKKLQRSNDASEMDMLKDKMNVIRKKLQLKPLTKEGIVNENDDFDEEEDYDLNAAFTASPASHSYDEILYIFISYEDEDILNKFKSSFPEGKDITKKDYVIFSQSITDDASEGDYIMANWISSTDDDVYEKAGLI